MKNLIIAVVAIIGLCTTNLHAAAELAVSVALSPRSAVPGIPRSVTFEITNRSARTKSLPRTVFFHVRRSDGSTFFARSSDTLTSSDVPAIQVLPQSSSVFVVPAGLSLRAPSWFVDDRLTIPGDYEMTAVFSDTDVRDLPSADLRSVTQRPHTVVSSPISMIVERPTGSDAAVCVMARDLYQGDAGSCPTWMFYSRSDVLSVIWRDYRDSTYARYLAGVVPGTLQEKLERLRDVIAREKDPEFADWRRIELGYAEEYTWGDALNRGDEKEAGQHAAAAASLYKRVAENGRTSELRRRAAEMAENLANILESRRAADARRP